MNPLHRSSRPTRLRAIFQSRLTKTSRDLPFLTRRRDSGPRGTVIGRLLLGACAVGVILVGNGCTVGPDHRAPKTTIPSAYHNVISTNITTVMPDDPARWWTVFRDPRLDSLIQRATESNLDLKLAEARLREARAARRRAAAAFLPGIDASGGYSRSRVSGNSLNGTGLDRFGIPLENDTYTAGIDMSWEIDVFGGNRRSREAATADLAAASEARNATRCSLLAELGLNYLELRGLQRQLEITRANLRSQEDTAAITRDRLNAGLGSELEVVRATAVMERTQGALAPLETAIQQVIHHLSILLGCAPATLHQELTTAWKPPIPGSLGVPLGLPSELLLRRPDIRQAERELAAATARIGVATADLFPRFYLTGAAGIQSLEPGDFVDGGSRFWSLGPTLRWPVFTAGRIRQTIRVQEARQEKALIRYEQAVLTSLEEVENALVSFGKEQERQRSLRDSETASRRAVDLARVQHRAGLVDFLDVLDAERTWLGAQEDLAVSERRLGQDLIRLYKALGGGWEPSPSTTVATRGNLGAQAGIEPRER